jgi:hypothetical protein
MKKIVLVLLIGIAFSACNQNKKKDSNLSTENQIAKDALTCSY